ncbi:cAMP-binding protein [Chondromyces apiculatus DSM 436]|uniref:cAMP-binding protein n=1 Tax=Chondromyces apiculatus DSM 436 TaxID=1192034 RepID=A0A017T0I4_9BACT|nr:cAMP-binding protein [Chondromyces apiculatus DSM 436]
MASAPPPRLPPNPLPPRVSPTAPFGVSGAPGAPDPERLRTRFGRNFAAGEVIFREGDPGTESFLIEEGRVRLIKRVRGAERSLMVLKSGDLLGESALLAGVPRSSTAIALSPVVALALDQATLKSLLDNHPAVALRIVKQLVARLRDAEDQIESMMLSDTQSKVVNALLKLSQQARDEGGGGAISFSVSPMELSIRVGLDVDTVKRAVQQLREGQYLRVSDERLEIPDLDALRRLYHLLGVKDEIRGDS